MRVGEYGISFNLNVNYDISGFTALGLVITRPDATVITRTDADVSVPATDIVTDDMGTFTAHKYAAYLFQAGDLTVPGDYVAALTYTDATKHLISDSTSFMVKA